MVLMDSKVGRRGGDNDDDVVSLPVPTLEVRGTSASFTWRDASFQGPKSAPDRKLNRGGRGSARPVSPPTPTVANKLPTVRYSSTVHSSLHAARLAMGPTC